MCNRDDVGLANVKYRFAFSTPTAGLKSRNFMIFVEQNYLFSFVIFLNERKAFM